MNLYHKNKNLFICSKIYIVHFNFQLKNLYKPIVKFITMPDQSLKQNQYKDTTNSERNTNEIRKKYEINRHVYVTLCYVCVMLCYVYVTYTSRYMKRKTLQFAHQIAHQFTHQIAHQIAHQCSRRHCTAAYTKVDEQFDEQFDE